MRLPPTRLHTKTTLTISIVVITVLLVLAYFSNLALNSLNDQQEQQQAQLLAIHVSDTVEHHVRRESRKQQRNRREPVSQEVADIPHWAEVQEEIAETIAKNHPELAEVRVFRKLAPDRWVEAIRLPSDAGPPSELDEREAARQIGTASVTLVRQQGHTRMVSAVAPVVFVIDDKSQAQIASVAVLLTFDESKGYAAEFRGLMWPLMILAIAAITLTTYFLFRYIVHRPIDRLLLAMSKAEGGNLTVEVEPSAPDEIGLLTSRFNRMLGRIRQMAEQLNLDQRRLESRVKEATAEIADRKDQVEEANIRLFEMQRQLSQLERLAAAGQTAAQFAHEVGTPLNLISGHVQLLRARATDERVVKRLDIIANQIERITGIVRSMLDSTRRPGLRVEPIDVNSLLVQILDATQPTLVAHDVHLTTELAEGLPHIDADPDQLQQVFINLISNSLDAMPAGGLLGVLTKQDRHSVTIEISDSGEGVAPDQIEMVFDPFFTSKGGRGTGLGLTIVKQIVTEHGGQVHISSEPGRGTTLCISLPLSAAAARLAAQSGIKTCGAGATPGATAATSGQVTSGGSVEGKDEKDSGHR